MLIWWRVRFRKASGASESDPAAPSPFIRMADAVSTGMGSPVNITFWFFAVVLWTGAFMRFPWLTDTDFLPHWFTSNAYNFPLNTVTTLAELFIGFLLAAAANRIEKRNYAIEVGQIEALKRIECLEQQIIRLLEKIDAAESAELAGIARIEEIEREAHQRTEETGK